MPVSRVRSHRKRSKRGKIFIVRSYDRRYKGRTVGRKVVYQRPPRTLRYVDRILKTVETLFPQYKPFIRSGRFLVNNVDIFIPILKEITSDKNNVEKIMNTERLIREGIKKELVPRFSKSVALDVYNMVNKAGFDRVLNIVGRTYSTSDISVFKVFFKGTLEEVVSDYLQGVM